jgi:hypothetical protein
MEIRILKLEGKHAGNVVRRTLASELHARLSMRRDHSLQLLAQPAPWRGFQPRAVQPAGGVLEEGRSGPWSGRAPPHRRVSLE